jgi:hypothetical protein
MYTMTIGLNKVKRNMLQLSLHTATTVHRLIEDDTSRETLIEPYREITSSLGISFTINILARKAKSLFLPD